MRHWVHMFGQRREVCDGDWSVSVPYVAKEIFQDDAYGMRDVSLKPGDVVVDVGANVGLFALYVTLRWPGVRVIAVEPVPSTFGMLWTNVWNNGVQDWVTLMNKAVSPAPVRIGVSREGSAGASAFAGGQSLWYWDSEHMPLDEIFRLHVPGRCAVLKVDCEGAEHEMFKSTRVLDRVDMLRAELHDSDALKALGHTADDTEALCRSQVKDCIFIRTRFE